MAWFLALAPAAVLLALSTARNPETVPGPAPRSSPPAHPPRHRCAEKLENTVWSIIDESVALSPNDLVIAKVEDDLTVHIHHAMAGPRFDIVANSWGLHGKLILDSSGSYELVYHGGNTENAKSQTDRVKFAGVVDGACTAIDFIQEAEYTYDLYTPTSRSWCRIDDGFEFNSVTTSNEVNNFHVPTTHGAVHHACTFTPHEFWRNGKVKFLNSAHSDVFWLGKLNDMKINSDMIARALDLMKIESTFKWEHECVLFLRAFMAYYPERQQELAERILEGRFEFGATFTEPFESIQAGELLVRQMYFGRLYFLEWLAHHRVLLEQKYSEKFGSVAPEKIFKHWLGNEEIGLLVFHQDGPLRAEQMPQIYAKSGVRFLKASRLRLDLFRWAGKDRNFGVDNSLLTYEELQYCSGGINGTMNANPKDPKKVRYCGGGLVLSIALQSG